MRAAGRPAILGVSLVLFCLLAPARAGGVDRSAPRFASGAEATNVTVTVSDTRGRFVGGLTGADFAVFEDGVPQTVALFARDEVPVTVDVLVDASTSMQSALPLAQAAARRLVEGLAPGDEARVIAFNDRVRVLQDFTSDRAALFRAVQDIEANGATALYTALYVSLRDAERAARAGLRRRAIVVLSDGEDTVSTLRDEDVVQRAKRGDVTIYAVGLAAAANVPPSRRDAHLTAAHFLTILARETGGVAEFPGRVEDLGDIYARIAREVRAQYTIGYQPRRPPDRTWRRIAVLVLRRDDVLVRHRTAYFAGRR